MKVKRVHILLVALIFLLSCMILGFNRETIIYADECVGSKQFPKEFTDDTIFKDEYDTFLEAYYTNLTKNIGYNAKGSCGYVALGMLLSYYDTYQCESIIEDKYACPSVGDSLNMNERYNSPGIYNDYVNADLEDWTNEDYYQYMYEYANDNFEPSFHAKLLTIGHDLGYYGKLSSSHPGSTNGNMVINILKKYLSDIKFAENTHYTITTKSSLLFGSSNIRDFVKENIQKGKPVLIGINNGVFSEGHFCIAYDYDETEDEIYANFGYRDKHQHTKVSNACSDYFFALTIDFKMEHTHTKNYVV